MAGPPRRPDPLRGERGEESLPPNYLGGGYLSDKGDIRTELLTTTADEVASKLGKAEGGKLKMHQLRRFFNHVRVTERRWRQGAEFSAVLPDIKELQAFAADACAGSERDRKAPAIFYEFIKKNIEKVNKETDFSEGFLRHFQAVVAFFHYRFPK